jgi:pyruvate kinase
LKSRKGINLPNTAISVPSLTPKDHADLLFGIEQGVDWVALSFVRSAQDILDLKEIVKAKGKDIKVISKIEKPEAITNMDEIIEVTDALMVARGDLGVEIDMARVPLIQKELISKCNKAKKPVIVATQMMESMITNPRPTRAETNDVANAIMDGADVVMLSGESAAGKYPQESVSAMSRIIKEVETNTDAIYHKYYDEAEGSNKLNDDLISVACELAEKTHAKAIVGMTESGFTALSIARHRPKAAIYVFTNNKTLVTRLNLLFGVTAFHYEKGGSADETITEVKSILKSKGLVKAGDVVVNTASMPLWNQGKTNMLKISVVE